MAQLIKLRDYISRYETNPFHYPTQFIRLKQENWHKLTELWEEENEQEDRTKNQPLHTNHPKSKRRFKWNFFKQNKNILEESILFKRSLPESKTQLRKYFLNQLYPFQLKWATSTLTHVSYTEQDHFFDQDLKFFLQHFPDIYFLMYYPIFNIKKAPIDVEILLISPVEIEIISIIDANERDTVIVTDERTWVIKRNEHESNIISPTIGLKRTEHVVEGILKAYDLSYKIRKTALSKDAHFLYSNEPYNVNLIGPDTYKSWYDQKRNLSASLKGKQLKVMEALLMHSLSNSVPRPEWEKDKDEEESSFIIGE